MIFRIIIASISSVFLFAGLWQIAEAPDPRFHRSVIVLCYHEIDPHLETAWSRTPSDIKQDLEALVKAGVHFYSLEQLISATLARQRLPTPGVVLTFDDATAGQYNYAYPLLQQYGVSATFYVPTEWVKTQRPGYDGYREMMSFSQLRELSANGHQVASHGHQHKPFRAIDEQEITQDIATAQRFLNEKLGIETTDFCFPNGSYRPEHEDLLVEQGYRSVALTTSFHGKGNVELIKLRRREIKDKTSTQEVLDYVLSGRI